LGNLAQYIAPISDNKQLHSTGVIASDNRLVISWYMGKHKDGDIVELPVGFFGKKDIDRNWEGFRFAKISPQLAWAWRWSFDDLVSELDEVIRKHTFMIDQGHIYKEKMWESALKAMNIGSLHDDNVTLDSLEPVLQKLINSYGNDQYTQWHELYKYTKKQLDDNRQELTPPWPGPDITMRGGGWIWEPYTDEQVLRRAREIYSAALQEYLQITDSFFKQLKPRMLIATLLPAKMAGEVHFRSTGFGKRTPGLNWHFEPLSIEIRVM